MMSWLDFGQEWTICLVPSHYSQSGPNFGYAKSYAISISFASIIFDIYVEDILNDHYYQNSTERDLAESRRSLLPVA